MIVTQFKRIVLSGWQAFLRDREVALATVFILFLSVGLIGSLFIFQNVTDFVLTSTQEKIDISVYFNESADEDDILGIQKEISRFPEVKEVEYVSSEQALLDFVERHQREPELLESIEEIGRNPFLASLAIRAWEPSQYGVVSNFLEAADFGDMIEKIDYFERKSVIDKLAAVGAAVSKIGAVVSLVLVAVTVMVSFNTIRLSIYNSSEEIKIQRLVGASNWAIRGPFLVQGAIAGVIATFVCFLILALLSLALSAKVESLFYGLNLFNLFVDNFFALLFLQLFAGIGLGVFSSSVAMRKYLKI